MGLNEQLISFIALCFAVYWICRKTSKPKIFSVESWSPDSNFNQNKPRAVGRNWRKYILVLIVITGLSLVFAFENNPSNPFSPEWSKFNALAYAAILILTIFFLEYKHSNEKDKHLRLLAYGEPVPAKIDDIEFKEKGKHVLYLQYQFNGDIYERKYLTDNSGSRSCFERGEFLTVVVDPNNPADFMVYDQSIFEVKPSRYK